MTLSFVSGRLWTFFLGGAKKIVRMVVCTLDNWRAASCCPKQTVHDRRILMADSALKTAAEILSTQPAADLCGAGLRTVHRWMEYGAVPAPIRIDSGPEAQSVSKNRISGTGSRMDPLAVNSSDPRRCPMNSICHKSQQPGLPRPAQRPRRTDIALGISTKTPQGIMPYMRGGSRTTYSASQPQGWAVQELACQQSKPAGTEDSA